MQRRGTTPLGTCALGSYSGVGRNYPMSGESRIEKRAPLRILHLEDDAADRELIRRTLEAEAITCDITTACSRDEFETALRSGSFDLILTDYTLPGFDGAGALQLAQQLRPELPYIFVSGTIGEDRAIESVKRGATDYVLKDRLERLAPAIRRALQEITEREKRRHAEEALRQSEERFREMAANIREVFWSTTTDGSRILYVSPAYEQTWGRSIADLLAHPARWLEAVWPDDQRHAVAAVQLLATGVPYNIEYRIVRPDGTTRWIEDRGYPVLNSAGTVERLVGVAVDITERKHLEAQLHQAQKMEAIGQLAGGVAHDFNNVLTVVTGYARLLLDGGSMPAEAIEPLTQIYTAGTRAANLTRQLLVFSRKQTVSRRAIDLNEVVDEIAKMLQRLIGEHITLKLDLSPTPPIVEADPGMIEQVLMNLAVNARDAMAEGGVLTLATEVIHITKPESRNHPQARAGDFVALTVHDTGSGIAPENLTRIFEPFFTTKEAGHGTGLGLATAFGIVQLHQGWIEVESKVGVSTCFRVLLPTTDRNLNHSHRRPAKAALAQGGSETMLLVEDEPAVREFAVAVLRSHGYRVLQAGSGVEALEVWKWHRARITLLFSDLVMPDGLGGVELAALLRKEKPTLKIVLTSGYADEALGQQFRPPAGAHFIRKPYKPQLLAQIVRDAFDDNFNY